jgi:putative endonuclease
MYFTYILRSLSSGRYYIGSTNNLIRRFHEHQSGENKATRNRGPWEVVHYEIHATRSAAVRCEHVWKAKKSARYINHIVADHPSLTSAFAQPTGGVI